MYVKIKRENVKEPDKTSSPTPKKSKQNEQLDKLMVDRLRIYPQVENLTDKDIKRMRPVCPDCGKKHAGPVCPCNGVDGYIQGCHVPVDLTHQYHP